MKTAILVDGAFFLKRYRSEFSKEHSPHEVAEFLHKYCYKHLNEKQYNEEHKTSFKKAHELYRIFYYDCPPLDKTVHNPVIGNVNLKKEDAYIWRTQFLSELKKKRKLAIRLGELSMNKTAYFLKPKVLKKLMQKKITIDDLVFDDFVLDIEQKGVDMRIGLDVASLAYKKQVERIVLIAGDSDFVPVAKLARREGIDFILDPLYNNIKDSLFEHIDGLNTCDANFNNKGNFKSE